MGEKSLKGKKNFIGEIPERTADMVSLEKLDMSQWFKWRKFKWFVHVEEFEFITCS